jgi:hypothetical protein
MSKKFEVGRKMAANFSTVLGTSENQYFWQLIEQNTVVLFSNLTTSQKTLWDGQKTIPRYWPFKDFLFFCCFL